MNDTKFTPEFIAQQRKLAERVTPLPWTGDLGPDDIKYQVHSADNDERVVMRVNHKDGDWGFEDQFCDVPYFFAACNNYPAALAEIEQLRAALERIADAGLRENVRWMARKALGGGERWLSQR